MAQSPSSQTKKLGVVIFIVLATVIGFAIVGVHYVRMRNHLNTDKYEHNRERIDTAPYIIKEDVYKMWYSCRDLDVSRKQGVCYAESVDGIIWKKWADNPVIRTTPGSWDTKLVGNPSVLKKGGSYHLWYRGEGNGVAQIGYATSPDGIHWTKYQKNPVLKVNKASTWDSVMLVAPHVLFLNGQFLMWYRGSSNQRIDGSHIGLAFSSDGKQWVRYQQNPVLAVGPFGSWYDKQVGDPAVIYDAGTLQFKMWFSGANINDSTYLKHVFVEQYQKGDAMEGFGKVIGYAISADGMHWKVADGPVVHYPKKARWHKQKREVTRIDNPMVVVDDGLYKMWCRIKMRDTSMIVYTQSPDGINWDELRRIRFVKDLDNEKNRKRP